jgi:ankyrin repeat protein
MIEQGADIEAKDAEAGGSVLHFAVMKGKLPIIDLLVSRGADINSRTKTGTTPLHTAVLYGQLQAVEYLAAKGADVNAQSASGTTPLRLAIAAKKEPIAARLRELGAR